jgi:hypothetical protein
MTSRKEEFERMYRGLGLPMKEEERGKLLKLPDEELRGEVQRRLKPEHNWWSKISHLAEGYAIEGPHPQRKGNLPVRLTGDVERKPQGGRLPSDEALRHRITGIEVHDGQQWRKLGEKSNES